MAFEELELVQVHNADETAFGVAQSSFSGRDIRLAGRAKMDVAQAFIDDPTNRAQLARTRPKLLGLKNATRWELPVFLRGTGTKAEGVAALGYANLAEGQLLRSAFGGESLGTGTTVAADPAPGAAGFTVASAAGLAIGQAILVELDTGNEASVISDISTNAISLVRALSKAPAASAKVWGAATYYPTTELAHSLQFVGLTAGAADHYYQIMGCALQAKFGDIVPGQLPIITYEVMAADWVRQTGGALANPDLSANISNPPLPGYASTMLIGEVGVTTRRVLHAGSLKLDPGLPLAALGSVSGVQGVEKYVRTEMKPTVEFDVAAWDTEWEDLAIGQEDLFFVHMQIGNVPGETVLIDLPAMAIAEIPPRVAIANSQLGKHVKGEGRSSDTAVSDITAATIRVHLL